MTQKLITRTQFAEMANVSAAAVTKACAAALAAACDGKRIDPGHPAAIKYIEKQARTQTPEIAPGIDPHYAKAVVACQQSGKWSERFLKTQFSVGSGRASKMIAQMKAAGVYGRTDTPAPTIDSPPKTPHVRGMAAAKEKRKREPGAEDGPLEVPENIEEFADMTLRELIDKFGTDVRFVDWLKATKAIEDIHEKRIKNAATKGELISRQLVRAMVFDPFNSAHLRIMKDGTKSIVAGVVSKHSAGIDGPAIEAYVSEILGSYIAPVKRKVMRVLADV
jgi:hypothetical protein